MRRVAHMALSAPAMNADAFANLCCECVLFPTKPPILITVTEERTGVRPSISMFQGSA